MKRITSIILAFIMILTLAPVNIFATDETTAVFSDVKDTDYYGQAAITLEKLNVLEGYPDGTFGAEKAITRAEMAAVVCRMIDKESDAEKAIGKTRFDDVKADYWASGYINIASEKGIINGDGNGRFRPEDDVLHEEAIKMVVCALGYGTDVEVDPKDWSKGYLEIADEKGISDDLKGTKGKASTRGDVAVMSYNGLATDTENSKIPAIPVASVEAGEYSGTKKVKLTTSTKDAEIYYTTDGTTPTVNSTKYTKEISISKTSTLKAIAVKNGVVSKSVMSVEYTIKSSGGGGGGGGGSYTPSAPTTYTVSFDLNYEGATGAPASQSVTKDNCAASPATPEREGFAFVGWYVDNTYTELFNFTTPITKAYTLIARWVDTTDTTDTDGDGLTDPIEEYYGTDKTKTDTDEDGLTDFFEIKSSNTNPLVADSDENGTNDANEDFDEDNLTNLQEQTNNCNPYSGDTDMDGLNDYDEINTHNTKPDIEDTDEDGIGDGDEIELGLNPLAQKTDGETLDSERTFAQTLSTDNISDGLLSADNAAIPSLSMNVAGNVDSNTTITNADDEALTTNKAVVGTPVSISTTADISGGEAVISFDISGGTSPVSLMSLENEETSQYLICKYSENDENTEFEPLDTSYSNGILSASIESEGTYFVLDTESFLTNLGIYPLDYFESSESLMLMSLDDEIIEEKTIIPHESIAERRKNANKKSENAVMMLSSIEELEEELTLMSSYSLGTRAQADIVFVIDVTGSMGGAIDNVATNVNKFADDLVNKYKINANFSVIEFQDITCDGLDSTIQHKNGTSNWWNARSVNSFKNEINNLYLGYGGDWAETPIDGLAMARNLVSSSSTQKFFVLVTDAPYKEDNQYGIKNMEEMINLLVADDINVSVITDEWSSYPEFKYDLVGYCIMKGEYDNWKSDVYFDSDSNEYFYLEYDYDTGIETSSKVYIDKSKVIFEVYAGYILIDGYYYEVYQNTETGKYYYIKWSYDAVTDTESYEEIAITDTSAIVLESDGKVSGYEDLYEKTGGVFGNIYDSTFSTTLDAIAGMIDVDVNDGSWIVLDNYETIKLEKAPTSDSDADTDKDGVLDVNELISSSKKDVRMYIETYLSSRGLSYSEYVDRGGEAYIDVYSFKSNPVKKDTDGDGINDKDDSKPRRFTITDRHLAMFAKLSYSLKDVQDNTSFDKNSLGYASVDELSGWKLVDKYIIGTSSKGKEIMFAANTYQNSSTKEIVVAFRGTDDGWDWLENLLIYPLPWTSHPQAIDAETYINKIAKKYTSNIYITGHSLGGYLAAYAAGSIDRDFTRCVIFNGLGMDLTAPKAVKNNLKTNKSKITNYRVEGDAVSVLGTHYGKEYEYISNYDVLKEYGLDNIDWWEYAGKMQIDFVKAVHDMRNFFAYSELGNRY